MKVTSLRYLDAKFHHPSPKIKKNPQNTNGRLAIPALAGLLVLPGVGYIITYSPAFEACIVKSFCTIASTYTAVLICLRIWLTIVFSPQKVLLAPSGPRRGESVLLLVVSVTDVLLQLDHVSFWNNLPASLRDKEVSCTEFRRQLKTFMFLQTHCGASWLIWLSCLINTLTYLLTYLLTCLLTYLLTHSLTHLQLLRRFN